MSSTFFHLPSTYKRVTQFCLSGCAVLTLIALPAWSFAQSKVGIVNVPRLLKESKSSQAASKRLEIEFSKRDQELQKIADQFKQNQDQIERNSATMSETERRNKERDLADQTRDIQRRQREFREDLERRQGEETAKIIDKAQAIINKIAEDEKFDLILRDAVYVSPTTKVDITDRVIKQLVE